jgi:DNA-binding CsgD family transcriptional regulator
MNTVPEFGALSKSLITNVPANLNSPEAHTLRKSLVHFPDEAIYIYSFKENRMIYADGWESVLGYRDDEINMLAIVNASVPKYAPFSYELNDKALKFILGKSTDLEHYSFSIELKKFHKNGTEVPVVAKVGVFGVENNRMVSIIGRFTINPRLIFGEVMRYAAYGPEKEEFEEELNKSLFCYQAISDKEREALALAAKGLPFKEIAHQLKVSPSAIEKRINPLYKRFNVNSLAHLVGFAYENHILP